MSGVHHGFAPCPFPPLELFNHEHSVLGTLAKDPKVAPGKAARKLFPKPWFGARLYRRMTIKHDLLHVRPGSLAVWHGTRRRC